MKTAIIGTVMKSTILLIALLAGPLSLFCQTNTPQYEILIRKADSLYQEKKFEESAFAFSDAFKSADARIPTNHRYNAACSWALANYPDSAFSNLNYIATFMGYTNFGHVKSDPDLISLHNDKRWKPLLDEIQANRIKAFPGLELIPVNGFQVEIVTYGLENNQKGKPVIVFENGRRVSLTSGKNSFFI
jgi:hypothetical protein